MILFSGFIDFFRKKGNKSKYCVLLEENMAKLGFLCGILMIYFVNDINGQSGTYYEQIGVGTSCQRGTQYIYGLNINVEANYQDLFIPNGITSGGIGPEDYVYRTTLCGGIDTNCGNNIALERVVRNAPETCNQSVATWNSSNENLILHMVTFDENPFKQKGVFIEVENRPAPAGLNCPFEYSIVNYDILCQPNITGVILTGITEDLSNCTFTISMLSKDACLNWSYNEDNNDNNNKISAGTIMIVVVIVIVLLYCVLGCAKNSFCHGRLGFDAIPNKLFWTKLFKYTKVYIILFI